MDKTTDRYFIIWLQLVLNHQIATGYIKDAALTKDAMYGDKTAQAVEAYWAA